MPELSAFVLVASSAAFSLRPDAVMPDDALELAARLQPSTLSGATT